jgi:hypothetical protein
MERSTEPKKRKAKNERPKLETPASVGPDSGGGSVGVEQHSAGPISAGKPAVINETSGDEVKKYT